MNKQWLSKCFILPFLLTSSLYAEHFHYNLNTATTLQVNKQKQLTALTVSWTYDETMTQMMLLSIPKVDALGDQIINDLKQVGYFIQLHLNGNPIPLASAISHKLSLHKQAKHNILQLNFTLPLQTPVSLQGNNILQLNLLDKNGSAVLFYQGAEQLVVSPPLTSYCQSSITNKTEFDHGQASQVVQIQCNVP